MDMGLLTFQDVPLLQLFSGGSLAESSALGRRQRVNHCTKDKSGAINIVLLLYLICQLGRLNKLSSELQKSIRA